MKRKSELWGLRCEIAGMCLLLLATFWENIATGWWDNAATEMQYLIQEKANLAILNSNQQILFAEMKSSDEKKRTDLIIEATQNIAVASRELTEDRQTRSESLSGQAELFSRIKLAMLLIGSSLLIIGKGCMLFATREKNPSL